MSVHKNDFIVFMIILMLSWIILQFFYNTSVLDRKINEIQEDINAIGEQLKIDKININ